MARLRKRYIWWLDAALAPVALTFGLALVEFQRPVNRVHNGMTYQQVEGLLGPADGTQPWWSDQLPCYLWKFRDGSHVWVYMDAEGRVRSKEFHFGPASDWQRRLRDLRFPF